ncbi:MAG: hypothetical protein AB1439_04860 [candidate division FCPU426 bacterium]
MRRLTAAGVLLMLLALAGPGLALADDPKAQGPGKAAFLFDQAIQNYLKGDSQQAIQQLNESLKLDPGNQRTKVFLLKILVERGSRLYLAKQYSQAYTYLSQAYAMDPGNRQVKQMYELAAKEIAPKRAEDKVVLVPEAMREEMLKQEAAAHTLAQGGALAASAMVQASNPAPAAAPRLGSPNAAPAAFQESADAASTYAAEYAKNIEAMSELLLSFQQQQARQITKFLAPMERLQNLYYQSEQDRRQFMERLDDRMKSLLGDVSLQQRMVIYGFVAGILILGAIVWAFFLILGRMRSRREEVIMKYQQEMLKMVRDMAGLPGGGYSALVGGTWMGPRLPGSAAPQLGAEPSAQARLLEQTQSGNLKERALAAVQLLRHDAEQAMAVIREWESSADPFQRESIIQALGEYYHPLSLEVLARALRDRERRVAAAAKRSLRRLAMNQEEPIPPDALAAIDKALKAAEAPDTDAEQGKTS